MKPYPTNLQGSRVLVMGLGQFGGGLGTTRWLAERGAHVLLTDLAPRHKLERSLTELQPLIDKGAVTLRLGEHVEADFASVDLVVANPAVPCPWENTHLAAARHAGVPVTTEIRLCVDRLNRARTLAVTGSSGKSSTSSMIARLLDHPSGSARLGGNIGGSLLNELPPSDTWTILELSSAMLWWLGEGAALAGQQPWSPRVGVLTNLAPNHVDWHRSLGHYYCSKRHIRAGQHSGDVFVSLFAHEQPHTAADAAALCGAWWERADVPAEQELADLLRAVELPFVPGEHQRRNARLAILAAEAALRTELPSGASPANATNPLRISRAHMLHVLKDFRALPHRLEFVGEFGGLQCFNDSKSTTPDATLLAVAAFPEPKRIHLIAGGYDKKVDLTAIRELAAQLGGLYAIGTTAPQLTGQPTAQACGTLENAVRAAAQRARPGDVLLLSPACASMDQFTNYEARGQAFSELVRAL